MYPRRMAPYPNPTVHMNQKRQQQPQVQIPQQMNSYTNPNMQPNYNSNGPPQVRAAVLHFMMFNNIYTYNYVLVYTYIFGIY